MPDPSLSEAIREAYASAPEDVVLLHTLEIRHPVFDAPVRLVLGFDDIVARLEATAPEDPGQDVRFTAFAWEMTLPPIVDDASPEVVIAIDGVSREIVAQAEKAAEDPRRTEITYRPYLSSDLSIPQMNPPIHMTVTNIFADAMRVTIRAGYGDLGNLSFPAEDYTVGRFPGLNR